MSLSPDSLRGYETLVGARSVDQRGGRSVGEPPEVEVVRRWINGETDPFEKARVAYEIAKRPFARCEEGSVEFERLAFVRQERQRCPDELAAENAASSGNTDGWPAVRKG